MPEMSKKHLIFIVGFFAVVCADAGAVMLSLDDALRATYQACVGIDEELSDLKKMAGINTFTTAVGTGLGIGAMATGISKAKIDETLAQKYQDMSDLSYAASSDVETISEEDFVSKVATALNNRISGNSNNNDEEKQRLQNEINNLENKSKRLGKWRTGLLAGNTVTNVAGAVIAGNNHVKKTLQEQIDDCKSSVRNLKDAILRAKYEGQDISEASHIQSVCGGFEYVDIDKINKRATGAMVSSVVGAGTGVVGTITSALANSKNIRDDDTVDGRVKEQNLNTASNILATGSTVASASATIFNATQIKAIKDVASVAQQCSEVLK